MINAHKMARINGRIFIYYWYSLHDSAENCSYHHAVFRLYKM